MFQLLPLINYRKRILYHTALSEMRLGDYSIINETAGFTEKDLDELSQNDAVESVAAIQFSLYDTEELVAGICPAVSAPDLRIPA